MTSSTGYTVITGFPTIMNTPWKVSLPFRSSFSLWYCYISSSSSYYRSERKGSVVDCQAGSGSFLFSPIPSYSLIILPYLIVSIYLPFTRNLVFVRLVWMHDTHTPLSLHSSSTPPTFTPHQSVILTHSTTDINYPNTLSLPSHTRLIVDYPSKRDWTYCHVADNPKLKGFVPTRRLRPDV